MKQYMCESCGWSLMSDSVPATCETCGDCEFTVVPNRSRPSPTPAGKVETVLCRNDMVYDLTAALRAASSLAHATKTRKTVWGLYDQPANALGSNPYMIAEKKPTEGSLAVAVFDHSPKTESRQ